MSIATNTHSLAASERGRPTRATPLVRDTAERDLPAVQAIYAYHVLHGTASFELVAPSVAEIALRHRAVRDAGLAHLVAEIDGAVVGYCYASVYRPRPAYRHTIENSVYIAHDQARRGIGGTLVRTLIERCEVGPWRQMIAVIGGVDNAGSIALHRSLGFQPAGCLRSAGWKFGRWLDTVLMQRAIGPGDSEPPGAGDPSVLA